MQKIGKNFSLIFLLLIYVLFPSFSHAYSMKWHKWSTPIYWRPILSLTAGGAYSEDVGSSKFIKIMSPTEDEFFKYSSTNIRRTNFLYGVFLGAEFLVDPKWFLQIGLGYYEPATFTGSGTVKQGKDAQSANSYDYSYDIRIHQLLLESKLLYACKKRFRPYVALGVGAGLNTGGNYNVNITPPFTTFSNQFPKATTTSFSYNVGFGVDMDVANQLRAGIGYRFTNFGKFKLGHATIDQVPTCNKLSQSYFYAHEVLAQLTFVM